MNVRTYERSPDLRPVYARVVGYGLLRRARLLGRHDRLPDVALRLEDVVPDAGHLAAYRRVCGFADGGPVPATYSHVLSFPLSLELMTDRSFPLPLSGLVHVRNTLTQYREVDPGERLTVLVHAEDLRPHDKGVQFDMVSEVRVSDELVWHQSSTYLHRQGRAGRSGSAGRGSSGGSGDTSPEPRWEELERFGVDASVSPRYAGMSGDRNPHHLHPLLAKVFGFRSMPAHGMWTKARALAGLADRLPARFTITGSFERPLLLPARVVLAVAEEGDPRPYALFDEEREKPYLTGTVDTRS
jgi:acyl dehydratase